MQGLPVISSFPSDLLPPNYNKNQLSDWYDSLTSLNKQLGEQCLWGFQNFLDQVVACYSQSSSHVSKELRSPYPGT